MKDDEWRRRLTDAIKNDGRTMRDVSLAAGLSHGYVHGILKDGKEPTLDRFFRICKELEVSVSEILLGVDISPQTEALISDIEDDPARRDALSALLKKQS